MVMFEKVVVLCGGGEEGKRARKGKGLVSPLLNHAGSIINQLDGMWNPQTSGGNFTETCSKFQQ